MDCIETIKVRRSIREYKDTPIPKEKLERIADAAGFAATARGVEPWEFIVVIDPSVLAKIAELAENGRFVAKAKACIAVFCQDTKYYLEDGCAATQNILLAATAQGLGSCWVAGDKKPYCADIAKLLNVPSGYKLVSMVALGFPAHKESFRVKDKRKLNQVLHWEKF